MGARCKLSVSIRPPRPILSQIAYVPVRLSEAPATCSVDQLPKVKGYTWRLIDGVVCTTSLMWGKGYERKISMAHLISGKHPSIPLVTDSPLDMRRIQIAPGRTVNKIEASPSGSFLWVSRHKYRIDYAIAPFIECHAWHINSGAPYRHIERAGERTTQHLGCFLLGITEPMCGYMIDFRDGDTKNYERDNIRLVTKHTKRELR